MIHTEKHTITTTINGRIYQREVFSRMLLSDFLRHELLLTGTHVGCEHGVCGCCNVMINNVVTRSCLTFAVQADGLELRTVEGLGKAGALHPVQEAFWEEGGLQCGFCTPGMLMSVVELLEHNPNPTREEATEAISGNLCRCTGYEQIVNSVMAVARKQWEGAVG